KATLYRQSLSVDESFAIPGANGNNSPARVKAAHVPTPSGNTVLNGSARGLAGLTEFEQAYEVFAGTNGANGELEPPDQGLAVGNNFVIEAINSALAVYDTSGNLIAAEALNPFFGLDPEFTIDPTTDAVVSFGPFLADPRVLYDASSGRFFLSILEIDSD